MGLVHRAGSGGEFNTFRRGKKHRRGLKVNFFPHPGSSGAKGASRGYQLGSAAEGEGDERLGGSGHQHGELCSPTATQEKAQTHRNTEGRTKTPGWRKRDSKENEILVYSLLPAGSQHRAQGLAPMCLVLCISNRGTAHASCPVHSAHVSALPTVSPAPGKPSGALLAPWV